MNSIPTKHLYLSMTKKKINLKNYPTTTKNPKKKEQTQKKLRKRIVQSKLELISKKNWNSEPQIGILMRGILDEKTKKKRTKIKQKFKT